MKFSELARYLEKLEKTSSRLSITEILSELFKKAEKDEVNKIVYLTLGSLAPQYESVVFNIAEKMATKSIASAFDKDLEDVRNLYKKMGDLGEVAEILSTRKKSQLEVVEVFSDLEKIAKDEGEGSQDRKIEGLAKLLKSLDPLSAKYVVRIILGKLRLGFSDKTILDALSWMLKGDKSVKKTIEEIYNVYPDVGWLAKSVKENGISVSLKKVHLKTGVPPYLMLAQRLKSPTEMIEKMGEVLVEPKFDGLRIQIHFKRNQFVKAYTRNLNETSWMFPELTSIGDQLRADEVILDSEAMGVDEKQKQLASFQKTMTRRRKHKIDEVAKNVSIRFYVFDILLKDGKSLLREKQTSRKKVLAKTIKGNGVLEIVNYEKTNDPKFITQKMKQHLSEGLEGVIVKRASSRYVAGRTGWRWVKMKEEETSVAKLADTIDCIVMGYYAGRGKRTSFGVGGFLVGLMDKKDRIRTLTKIGTGLTDDQFRELKKRLSKLEVNTKPKEYGEVDKTLLPDFWVWPKQVVEIAADEITKSPLHSSGFALRFPRLVKFRDDKAPINATSIEGIKELCKLQ